MNTTCNACGNTLDRAVYTVDLAAVDVLTDNPDKISADVIAFNKNANNSFMLCRECVKKVIRVLEGKECR